MKKKQNTAPLYPMPEGYYVPVDPQVKNKASNTSKCDYAANATMRKAVISSALDLYNISWRTNIPLTK